MKERLIITYGKCWAGRSKYPPQVRTPTARDEEKLEHSQPSALGAHRSPPTALCRLQSPCRELNTWGRHQKSMLFRERRKVARLVSVIWLIGLSDSHSGKWTVHRILMLLEETQFSSLGGKGTGGPGWLLQDPWPYAIQVHSLVRSCTELCWVEYPVQGKGFSSSEECGATW